MICKRDARQSRFHAESGSAKKMLFVVMAAFVFSSPAFSQELHVIEIQDAKILFDAPLRTAAKEIAAIYPNIRDTLEKEIGWKFGIGPIVIIIRDANQFEGMAPHSLAVAFAIPKSQTIVIDYTKMFRHPFSIGNTLKHELCHLLLHNHIQGNILPRWLDEGVCQWSSDWIGDIIIDQKRSLLNVAALRGRFIPLRALEGAFPRTEEGLILAYEESRGFVEYTIKRYGGEGLLKVLDHMKNGQSVETAFMNALSVSLDDLERDWHESLTNMTSWFMYLSYYLYEIVFGLMALLSIYGFIRIIMKKRAYMKEEMEESR